MIDGVIRRITRLLRALAGRDRVAPATAPDPASRPYTRWWWFSGPIEAGVVERQLDWARANGFGGVEIAWVYPLRGGAAGPRWLSPEWTELVAHAKRHAEALGLGCDFTFGTLWPFGGSFVPPACSWMRRGRAYAGLAVYLPLEDNRMRDRLPPALRTPAAHSYWELRQEVVPEEAEPYGPLWVSAASLAEATWDGSKLRVGAASFDALLLSCHWLDLATLDTVLRLAGLGLPVALSFFPRRPGRRDDGGYEARLDALAALPNVRGDLGELGLTPPVEGERLPPYWARVDGDGLILFFAHPGAWDVRYPMTLGQARSLPAATRAVVIHSGGRPHRVSLDFPPGRSVLLRVAGGGVETIALREPRGGFR